MNWWRDERRVTFKGYYYVSLVFYSAYFILMSLVIATSTQNLNNSYIFGQVESIALCIPQIWFLVYTQNYNDQFSFTKSQSDTTKDHRVSINVDA